MIRILIEENYIKNNRFQLILNGISSVAKRRHIDVAIHTDIAELKNDCRLVILICQSLKWSTDHIEKLNERNIHPLVFGFQYLDTTYKYSSIAPNYTKSAYRLTKYVISQNKGKTAVLGYNEDSLPDRLKYIGIRYAVTEEGQPYEVFKNHGDILECLDRFALHCADVKNIVCCNDNVAVMLYTKYAYLLQDKTMCSCSGLKISEYFETPYPVCRIDYCEAGVQLALLYLFLLKEESIYSTVMTFDMDFSFQEEAGAISLPSNGEIYSQEEVNFFGDKNLETMERLDKMLGQCDETDLLILKDVVDNVTYETIADEYYLAVNTVKYRMKKLLDAAGVTSRKELLRLLEEYKIKFKK